VQWDSTELGDDGGRLPAQRPSQDVLWAGFVADGQWLLAYYPGGESELIEVTGTGRFRFSAGASPAMSDDGRWLVSRADGQYVVVAVSTGEEAYRFGNPAADGPPGDVGDRVANGLVFTKRSAG
jgi:outer membrane protein assembly factor BamB